MHLYDFVDQYELCRAVSPGTVCHYRRTVRSFSRWLGHEARVADLTVDHLNQFLRCYEQMGRSPHYRKSLRADLLALWRAAAEEDLVDGPRRRVRPVRLDPVVPDAWTVDEIRRLLAAVPKAVPGRFRTLDESRALYFDSLIRAAWDTGLRRTDLHSLRRDQVAANGVVLQSKTRRLVPVSLSAETIDAIRQMDPERQTLWPLWGTDDTFRQTFAKIVWRAGLSGPFKKIRKSAGSAAEAQHSGRGHEFLGNTRKVFEQYYLDRRVPDPPRPPGLGRTG